MRMKKFLFLSLALTCALAGYAQKPTVKDGYITKSQMKDLPNQKHGVPTAVATSCRK